MDSHYRSQLTALVSARSAAEAEVAQLRAAAAKSGGLPAGAAAPAPAPQQLPPPAPMQGIPPALLQNGNRQPPATPAAAPQPTQPPAAPAPVPKQLPPPMPGIPRAPLQQSGNREPPAPRGAAAAGSYAAAAAQPQPPQKGIRSGNSVDASRRSVAPELSLLMARPGPPAAPAPGAAAAAPDVRMPTSLMPRTLLPAALPCMHACLLYPCPAWRMRAVVCLCVYH
jgi:hypothetical protein